MLMAFALCPDQGPPRLWRFVDDDVMTADRVVSILDSGQNILVINKPLYEQLGELNRHMLLRTQRHLEYV
jgi:hypothetical protein